MQPDDTRFVVGTSNGDLLIGDFTSIPVNRRTVFDSGNIPLNIVFEPSGQRFATIANESTSIAIHDSSTGKRISTITNPEPSIIVAAQFETQGSSIWIADGNAVLRRYDVNSGKFFASQKRDNAPVLRLLVSPGREYIAVEYWLSPDQRMLSVWNASFTKPIIATTDFVSFSSVFLSEQSFVFHPAEIGIISFLDIPSGSLSQRFKHPTWITGLTVSPDASTLVTLCADKVIRLWDIESGELRSSFRGRYPFDKHVAISPDGKTLATGVDKGPVVLWHLPTQQPLFSLGNCPGEVQQMTFSADGRRLLMAVNRSKVIAWEASPRE